MGPASRNLKRVSKAPGSNPATTTALDRSYMPGRQVRSRRFFVRCKSAGSPSAAVRLEAADSPASGRFPFQLFGNKRFITSLSTLSLASSA